MSHMLILYSNSPIEIAPQILLFANPTTVSVDANGTASVPLTLRRINYRALVNLVANSLPAHVTASFSPPTLIGTEEFTTVTFTAGASAAAGTTTVQIEASGVGVLDATLDLALTVATPAYAIDVDPDNPIVVIVQASNASVAVHCNRIGGYTGDVTPSVSGLPSGVSGAYVPSVMVYPVADAVLNLTATGGATPVADDPATIAMDGAGVLQATAPLLVTVQAAPVADPVPSGEIWLDTRAGGAHDIQAQSTFAAARLKVCDACRDSNGGPGGVGQGDCDFLGNGNGNGTSRGSLSPASGTGTFGINFTTNFDGAGTRAFRLDYKGYGNSGVKSTAQSNATGTIAPYVKYVAATGTFPREIYVQWKSWMGRTPTGGGYDDTVQTGGVDRSSQIGRFAVVNEEITQNNASRKWLLLDRAGVGGGACGRYDYIWAGQPTTETAGVGTVTVTPTSGNAATAVFSTSQSNLVGKLLRINPEWEIYEVMSGSGTTWTLNTRLDPYGTIPAWSAKGFSIMTKRDAPHRVNGNVSLDTAGAVYCGAQTGMPQNAVAFNQTGAFDIEEAINQVNTYTAYAKCSSSMSAADGIVRVWMNGQLISERTNVNYGDYAIYHFQMGAQFEKPRWNQTEYWWDIVSWYP